MSNRYKKIKNKYILLEKFLKNVYSFKNFPLKTYVKYIVDGHVNWYTLENDMILSF